MDLPPPPEPTVTSRKPKQSAASTSRSATSYVHTQRSRGPKPTQGETQRAKISVVRAKDPYTRVRDHPVTRDFIVGDNIIYMNTDEFSDDSSQTNDDDNSDEEIELAVEDLYDLHIDLIPRFAFNAAIFKANNN
jgi:hypothetical protein